MYHDNIHSDLRRDWLHEMVVVYVHIFDPPLKPRPMKLKKIENSIRGRTTTHQQIKFDPSKPKRQVKCKYCWNWRDRGQSGSPIRKDTTFVCSVCGIDDQPVGLCHPSTNRQCWNLWPLHANGDSLLEELGLIESDVESDIDCESDSGDQRAFHDGSNDSSSENEDHSEEEKQSETDSDSQSARPLRINFPRPSPSPPPPATSSPSPSAHVNSVQVGSRRRRRRSRKSSLVSSATDVQSTSKQRGNGRPRRHSEVCKGAEHTGSRGSGYNLRRKKQKGNDGRVVVSEKIGVLMTRDQFDSWVMRVRDWLREYFEDEQSANKFATARAPATQLAKEMRQDGIPINSEELRMLAERLGKQRGTRISLKNAWILYCNNR